MALVVLWLFYGLMIILFALNMLFCQYVDSSHLFSSFSILLSFTTVSGSIIFKESLSELNPEFQLLKIPTAAFGFILTMKFLELSIGYSWSYTRLMSFKLIMMFLLAFPKMPHRPSECKEKISNATVLRESFLIMCQGFVEYIIYRFVLYWIPSPWLTVVSSELTLFPRLARYGLLCILLYLLLTWFLNVTFGLAGCMMNYPMNRMFPEFPFTSSSLRDFWSYRWNSYIKSSLQRMSFLVMPQLLRPFFNITKKTSGLFASLLSGLFHEYILWFIIDRWSYQNMLFFFIHGLLVRLEITLNLPAKPNNFRGRCFGWLWTISSILITSPLFFDPWINIGIFSNMK